MSVPNDTVEEFRCRIPALTAGYAPADIFNADETALYYKQLPERTLNFRSFKTHGSKKSKERLTVLLCCSMVGEKLPPLVIGKYANPRCFRGGDVKNLPCEYKHTKNAWMTTGVFEAWLLDVNRKMACQGRSILLLIDNATCHRTSRVLQNLKIVFLPPKCSAVLQPLDQGVIWSFKCIFRRNLLEYVLSLIDSESPTMNIDTSLLLALHIIKKSWLAVHPDVVLNSFHKAGLDAVPGKNIPEPPPENCELIDDFESYVSVDDRLFEEEIEALERADQMVNHIMA